MTISIKSLLASRETFPEGEIRSHEELQSRHKIARFIAENYRDFEPLRLHLIGNYQRFQPRSEMQHQMLAFMRDRNLVRKTGEYRFEAVDIDTRIFFSGRWLEEYAYFAALAAGYDEVEIGRIVRWRVGSDEGVNEIDLMARKDDRLLFVSCKAIKSNIEKAKPVRDRLITFLHEADNIVDHFGGPEDQVALFCTADIYDEYRADQSRFPTLTGKARVLEVEIMSLEDLAWNEVVSRFRKLTEFRRKL